jgi:hypothetical protein
VLEGRLLDRLGSGLSGIAIATTAAPQVVVATSGDDGSFSVRSSDSDPNARLVIAEGECYRALSTPDCNQVHGSLVLVAAPAVEISGQVLGTSGEGTSASVSYDVPTDALTDFPLPLDYNHDAGDGVQTDGEGRFRIRVPLAPQIRLFARAGGASGVVFIAPDTERSAILRLYEENSEPDSIVVRGRVEAADSTPARGATVGYGIFSTLTDELGGFEFRFRRPHLNSGSYLYAVHVGYQPALVDGLREVVADSGNDEAFFDVQLGGPALAIIGKVLDEQGNPLEDWNVDLHDGALLTPGWSTKVFAEHYSGGRPRPDPITTGVDGSFCITGLFDAEYILDAWYSWDPVMIRSSAIKAGTTDVVLRLPEAPRIPVLRGKVVDKLGNALDGTLVEARLDLPLVEERKGSILYGAGVQTDEFGRFELTKVPRYNSKLRISGASIIPTELDIQASDDEFILQVDRRCHLRVEIVGNMSKSAPDEVAILGANGSILEVLPMHGRSSIQRVPIVGSRTPVVAVGQSAALVVAYRDNEVVGQQPVTLVPGAVQSIVFE